MGNCVGQGFIVFEGINTSGNGKTRFSNGDYFLSPNGAARVTFQTFQNKRSGTEENQLIITVNGIETGRFPSSTWMEVGFNTVAEEIKRTVNSQNDIQLDTYVTGIINRERGIITQTLYDNGYKYNPSNSGMAILHESGNLVINFSNGMCYARTDIKKGEQLGLTDTGILFINGTNPMTNKNEVLWRHDKDGWISPNPANWGSLFSYNTYRMS